MRVLADVLASSDVDPLVLAQVIIGMTVWIGAGLLIARDTGRHGGSFWWAAFWILPAWPITIDLWAVARGKLPRR